jgi:NADPH2:quinone reductase
LRVIGTAGTDEGRALVREQGAAGVVDHEAPDYAAELLTHTNGRGFDVIIEMLANVNLALDLTLLAPRGRVIVVGSRGPIEINPREIMARNADVRGVMLFGATTDELDVAHAAIRTGLESGALRPVVGRRFPLARAAEAHQAILAPGALGKIVLVP